MFNLARVAVTQVRSRTAQTVARGGGDIPWGMTGHTATPGSTMPFKVVGASKASLASKVAILVGLGIGLPCYGVIHSQQ